VAQRYRDQGASAYLYFGPDPHGGRVGEAVELSYKMVPQGGLRAQHPKIPSAISGLVCAAR
jgi:hypothetical protein